MAANPATLQQAAGLHPFVTDMKIVNPMMYPTIDSENVTTKEWCQPVITKDDFNMYTIVTEPVNVTIDVDGVEVVNKVSQARLVKFQRQYFHENYFVATTATLLGGEPAIIRTSALYIDATDTTYFNPMLTYAVDENILFTLVNREVRDDDGVTTASMLLTAYKVNDSTEGGGQDVRQLWQKEWTPVKTDTNLYGTMLDGDGKIYWYKLDDRVLSIRPFNITGNAENNEDATIIITLNQTYSYCKLTMSLVTNRNTYYITVRTGNIIRMATGLLTGNETTSNTTLTAFITVATASGVSVPTVPEVLAFATQDQKTMCSVIHGYNYDTNNILRVVYIPNIVKDGELDISGLETPFYYNLNKFQLFTEQQNATQSDVSVSVTSNPMNSNFSYVAYLATTDQIRIVKLYRNSKVATASYETYVPIVMWATRLDVIKDTFKGKVALNVDSNGNVYVFTWSADGNINISKIREYIMDLGHTEGTVIAPINTITTMLTSMTNEYTILTPRQGFLYSAFPTINDVTIDKVNNDGQKLDIKFNYLNYTYLQAFPDIVTQIRQLIINTFITLYDDSSITVLNLDPTEIGLEGDVNSLNVYLPIGTSKKPCVVKGTEIIRLTHDKKAELIAVEHIRVGDMLLNHEGKYVKVLDHLCSTIYAQEHNAPFLVPRGFFGINRPYKDLLISGDHGILVHFQSAKNMKVVYAEDISVLKRVLLGITVEFHHLLLESHQGNFYVANGLEVDSYHPVAFMRS